MSARTTPKSALAVLFAVLVATTVNYAAAPGTPLGSGDTLVNTTVTKAQTNSAVARDADGDYIVVWQSDVSALGDGSDIDIFFQRYSVSGTAVGSPTRANTTLAGVQQNPSVAVDPAGNFAIAWDSDQVEAPPTVPATKGIWFQRYNSSAAAQGAETQVNTYTTNDQQAPALAMDAAGNFVIAWQSLGQDTSGQGVYAQRFDATGVAAGSEFQVNTVTSNSQAAPAVAMNAGGDFVIAWQSNGQEGGGLVNGVYAQAYATNGTAAGGETHVNATTAGEQKAPSVGIDAYGNYVVAWESPDSGGTGITARIIDATGAPATGEVAVNTTTAGEQTAPAIAVDADGDFVVAWQGTDASGIGVSLQRFNASGVAQGAETLANGTTGGTQQRPAVGADADGDFVVAWESDQVPANGFDVFARRFTGPEDVDLSITKTDSPDPVVSGNAVTYTLKVTNNHTVDATTGVAAVDAAIGSATGIVVTDALPGTFSAFTGTHADWSCANNANTVTCTYGKTLAAGATTGDIKIVMNSSLSPGEFSNSATVSAHQYDSVSANNAATQATASCAISATPGSLQFSATSSSIGENGGTASIVVTRSSGLCGRVTVKYATSNGTATAGSDYNAVSGTLEWAENDNANKTITVPITNDAVNEPNETVTVTLSNADRATLGANTTHTLTINDDDAVTVGFSTATQTVGETGLVTVTATRTGATTFTITVPFTVSGTATGADHNAVNGNITIPPNASSGSYQFSVTEDVLDEADETVVFTMGTPTGGNVSATGQITHTVTIADDDATPTVSFNPASATLVENNTGMQGVIVTAQLDAVSGRAVTVPFTVSGSATAVDGDHTASAGTITIAAGATTGTYTYQVNGDTRFEDDETVIITMGTPTNATKGAETAHTTTITNDDNAPGVTLAVSNSGTMAEAAGSVQVTATLDAVSGKATTVHLLFSGTATLASDYTRSGTTITIPAGSTTGSITLTAVQDTTDETDETIIVDVDTVDAGTEMLVQQVTATIIDDDAAPNATLTLTGSPLAEAGGTATVSATLAAVSAKDVTISLTYSGTATVTDDYARSASTLLIPAGQTTPTTPVTLTAVQDSLDEPNETIIVDMACDANCTEATTQQVTATITDDDSVTVSFAANQTVGEADGMVTVTATRSGASTFAITVPFTLSGTATSPADHNAVAGNITIPASANATENGSYTFMVSDDARDEADETVIFTMGTPPTGGSVTAAAPTTHTVTITDNDAVTVAFSAATQTVGEGAGSVTVTATRTGVTDFAITVPFTVSGAAVNPADHNAANGSITIPAGSANGTYTFTVVQDSLDEMDETVVFTMGTPTGGTVTAAAPSTHTVTVTDDDAAPTVQFATTSQSASEDVSGGTVTVTVQLSGNATAKDVQVNYATGGTATSGSDYTLSPAVPGPLLIPAGQTSGTITVSIINDPTQEPSETATITLQTPANATLGANTTHTLTINDNDAIPQVSFTTASQSRGEGSGTAQIVVQLTRTSSEDVNVPFTVTGTATGADYTIDASPVTVVAGQTTAVINVPVTNDTLDEGDETVVVTMGTPANATPTGTTVHTLTITDDDSAPTVSFSAASQSVAEGTGAGTTTVTVTANLSAASSFDVTVPFTVGGTATGADHNAANGSITITAGATSGTTTFMATRDSLDEADETVVFTMGTPTNATAAAPTTHTVTITDDDAGPNVSFSAASQSVAEGTGAGTTTVTVTANLSAVSGQAVTVPFTVGGTATGADHNAVNGSITINAGATSGTTTFTVTRDSLDESDETVVFTMGAPTNATATAPTTHTVTITDDDGTPTVSFGAASQSVAEGTGAGTTTVTVTATLSASSGQAVTVPFTIGGTATGADHNAVNGSITINAGATSGTTTFTVTRDSLDESDETVVFTMGTPTNATAAAPTMHTVTITDDDAAPTVTLSASGATMAETGGSVTLTATLSAASSRTVTVSLGFGGTATNGADYTASATSITINPGSTTGSVTLTSVGDTTDEPDETVIADITAVTNGTESGTQTQTVTLTDDDSSGGGGGGGGSFGLMSLWLLLPALARRRRQAAR